MPVTSPDAVALLPPPRASSSRRPLQARHPYPAVVAVARASHSAADYPVASVVVVARATERAAADGGVPQPRPPLRCEAAVAVAELGVLPLDDGDGVARAGRRSDDGTAIVTASSQRDSRHGPPLVSSDCWIMLKRAVAAAGHSAGVEVG